MKRTAVDWLAEKYNYVTWLRNRDEVSADQGDRLRKIYLEEAKQMEKQKSINDYEAGLDNGFAEQDITGEQYYKETYEENEETN